MTALYRTKEFFFQKWRFQNGWIAVFPYLEFLSHAQRLISGKIREIALCVTIVINSLSAFSGMGRLLKCSEVSFKTWGYIKHVQRSSDRPAHRNMQAKESLCVFEREDNVYHQFGCHSMSYTKFIGAREFSKSVNALPRTCLETKGIHAPHCR